MTDQGTILVVDDESESLRLLTNILQTEGYQVRPADTGELALKSVDARAPELILLDLRMPNLDGFEVCRRLKARKETRDIPLIFISAANEVEEHVEGLRLGAVDFISKPFRSEELLARVRTHLELGRLRARLETLVAERTAELLVANRQLQVDLVELTRAGQALRESEERFSNVADTAPVLIWGSGPDKLCTFFNKPWLEFTGRSMEEELGEGWTAGVHPDDLDRCYSTYSSAFDARRSFQMEYRLRRADGEYRWMLDTGIPRFVGGVLAGYIGTMVDITDLKRNQEQLLATQKLESLGVLAAGIAHDFNNMLGSIFAEGDLAMLETPPDSPVRGSLDRISAVAIRASEVLNLLMDYAGGKGDEASFELVDVSSLIEGMLEFLRVSISKKAVFKTSLATDLPAVWANPTQLRRVIMNLVTNASEALRERQGMIHVTTTRMSLGQDFQFYGWAALPKGDYILLEVSDTGCGMTEQSRAKIFDPFYTTKSFGRGLGLAAVQGIVRSLGGAINVVSVPDRGATFRVFIPCAVGQAKEKESAAPAVMEKETAPANRTILFVEDEDTLRLAVSKSLQKHGFSVIVASDGHAAVDLFGARARDIDAILLDLTLPGMSGPEVFREVRRVKPNVKVIFTSAYDQERISASSMLDREALSNFIRKPYRIHELVRTLRNTLRQTDCVEDA
ncbi:MAG: response regulator [Acidobacteriaceae bacterium]|nr:response regulator [Acidobacteriaceae bacterium]